MRKEREDSTRRGTCAARARGGVEWSGGDLASEGTREIGHCDVGVHWVHD